MSKQFLDTNILLYAVSQQVQDSYKTKIAMKIVETLKWSCSAQVLQEFYYNATKKEKAGISPQAAQILVDRFSPCAVVSIDSTLVQHAIAIYQKHQLSYWDGAIIAAAIRCGADELLTEDLNAGQVIEGVRVVNPFV